MLEPEQRSPLATIGHLCPPKLKAFVFASVKKGYMDIARGEPENSGWHGKRKCGEIRVFRGRGHKQVLKHYIQHRGRCCQGRVSLVTLVTCHCRTVELITKCLTHTSALSQSEGAIS